jgi:hypothetical protein
MPNNNILWSPRAGFNWDITGDKRKQVRGGTGILLEGFSCVDWKSSRWNRSFFYQVVDPNFKFPQVWRTSLGYDHKFDSNYIVTVDASFNKDLNGVQVQNGV